MRAPSPSPRALRRLHAAFAHRLAAVFRRHLALALRSTTHWRPAR